MQSIINQFVTTKKLALVGVSRDKNKWGYYLYESLTKKGYTVLPVNPNCSDIFGIKCYTHVKELPTDIENVIIATPATIAEKIATELSQTKIKRVWFQESGNTSHTNKAIEICKKNGHEIIYGLCPMMFFPPVGLHKIHLNFKKWFNKLPKEYKIN